VLYFVASRTSFSLACLYCRPQLLQAVIGLFELPRDESAAGENIPDAIPSMNGVEQQNDEASGFLAFHTFIRCKMVTVYNVPVLLNLEI